MTPSHTNGPTPSEEGPEPPNDGARAPRASDGPPEDVPEPPELTNIPGLRGDPPGNRRLRWSVGIVAAVLAAAGIAWLSQVPYTVHGEDTGMLRLSWRVAGETLEECRPVDAAEAGASPEHMTQEEICQERVPPHRLRLEVEGRTKVDRVMEPGGMRSDRPFFIQEDLLLEPGKAHDVRVSFGPDDAAVEALKEEAAAEGVEMTPAGDRDLRQRSLHQDVTVGDREIALVTLGDDGDLTIQHADPQAAREAAAAQEDAEPPRRAP